MRISKLYILIGFFVANIGPAESTNPLEPDADAKRKMLFLHVGPQKTGSSTIQKTLKNNHAYFQEKGLYYPRFIQGQKYTKGHSELAYLVREGKMDEVYAEMKEITAAAGSASILLSSEQFSPYFDNPHFVAFISYLQQNYDLRVIYCIRNTTEVLASALCFSAFYVTDDMLAFKTAEPYLMTYFAQINRMILYFAQFKTIFLFFDELTADHKLVGNFFKQCFDMDVDLPEITIYDKGSHGQCAPVITTKQVRRLEKFAGLAKGELSSLYNSPDDPNKSEFTNKLYAYGLMQAGLLLNRFSRAEQADTTDFLARHPVFQNKYIKHANYKGRVLDYLIQAHRYMRRLK